MNRNENGSCSEKMPKGKRLLFRLLVSLGCLMLLVRCAVWAAATNGAWLFCSPFVGKEYDSEIVWLATPPRRIRYPMGYSGEIDLAGISVEVNKTKLDSFTFTEEDVDFHSFTDADFTAPGSYIVEVRFSDKQGVNHKFWFTIAVEEP